jgi:hypothetical protein
LYGILYSWLIIVWAIVFLSKCLSDQMLSGQMSLWANVVWANVFLGNGLSDHKSVYADLSLYIPSFSALYAHLLLYMSMRLSPLRH